MQGAEAFYISEIPWNRLRTADRYLLFLPRPAFENKGFLRVGVPRAVKLFFYSSPPFPFSQSLPEEAFFELENILWN